ncbi:hypothetical protein [Methylobacterium sp. Leaf106]|nr:hypothetical protein [Methylobacterium sp. Leaf106]
MTTEGALCLVVAAICAAWVAFVVIRGPGPDLTPISAPLKWNTIR